MEEFMAARQGWMAASVGDMEEMWEDKEVQVGMGTWAVWA